MLTLAELTQFFSEASKKKRVCRIRMKDEPLTRTIHPYGICMTLRKQIVLVCWQSMGFTKAGGKEGYRNLVLEDCEEVEMLDTHFKVDKNFNVNDDQYKDWVYHI